MSGLVLYISTPPPGVPFRFKSKSVLRSPATLPTRITLQRALRSYVSFTRSRGRLRAVGRCECVCFSQHQMQSGRKFIASARAHKNNFMENTQNFQLLNARSGQSVNLSAYVEAVESGDRQAVENAEAFGLVAVNRENGVASDEAITAAAQTMRQALDGYLNRPVAGQGAIPDGALIRVLPCSEGEEDKAVFLRPFTGRRNSGQTYTAIAVTVRFSLLDASGNVLASFVDIPLGMLTWDTSRRTDANGSVHSYAEGHIGTAIEAQNMTLQEAVRFLQGRVLRTQVETYLRPGKTNPTRLVSLIEEAPAPAATTRGRGRRNA